MMERHRGLEILAKTLYRDLTSQGYERSDIVNLATQLLAQVTDRMGDAAARRG